MSVSVRHILQMAQVELLPHVGSLKADAILRATVTYRRVEPVILLAVYLDR